MAKQDDPTKRTASHLDDAQAEQPSTKKSKAEDDGLDHGVLERGTIHFVYKPKVETEDPSGIDDISKLHLILSPRGGKPGYRLISIGKKQMPSPKTHQPMWATVASVGDDKAELKDALGPSTYETKTRGTRHQPAARPVGVGAYILHSKGSTTYLAYALASPDSSDPDVGKVQQDLNIFPQASAILQVKDPDQDGPPQASLPRDRRASYPADLKELFKTKFIQANPPRLLDYPGAELLIIGGRKGEGELEREIGKEATETVEHEAEKEDAVPEEVLNQLHLDAKDTDTAPIEGQWA